MKKKIKLWSSPKQTSVINELLGKHQSQYSLADIYEILPEKLEYRGMAGYLKISNIDIVYSSLETELQGKVVMMWQYMVGDDDIFDGFIAAIKWMKKNNVL